MALAHTFIHVWAAHNHVCVCVLRRLQLSPDMKPVMLGHRALHSFQTGRAGAQGFTFIPNQSCWGTRLYIHEA